MRVGIVGAGISGLCAATLLADDGHSVTILDGAPGAGGRAATPNGIEHCSRIFLDDYSSLRVILDRIPSGNSSIWGTLRPISRIARGKDQQWSTLGGPYTARSDSLPLTEKIRLARSRRKSPLLADQSRPTKIDLAKMAVQLSPVGWVRVARLTLRVRSAYAFPGSTDRFLANPWLETLQTSGAMWVPNAQVREIVIRQGRVRAVTLSDERTLDCDAVVVATTLPQAVSLLDHSGIDHRLRVSPHAFHSLTSATFMLHPEDRAARRLPSDTPSLIAGGGFYVVYQPDNHRCVAVSALFAPVEPVALISQARLLLGADLPVEIVGSTTNREVGEQLFGGTPPGRRLLPRLPGVYLAGSYLSRSYPIDSGEAAARSAFAVRDAMRHQPSY